MALLQKAGLLLPGSYQHSPGTRSSLLVASTSGRSQPRVFSSRECVSGSPLQQRWPRPCSMQLSWISGSARSTSRLVPAALKRASSFVDETSSEPQHPPEGRLQADHSPMVLEQDGPDLPKVGLAYVQMGPHNWLECVSFGCCAAVLPLLRLYAYSQHLGKQLGLAGCYLDTHTIYITLIWGGAYAREWVCSNRKDTALLRST